jgi:hypothetical protein
MPKHPASGPCRPGRRVVGVATSWLIGVLEIRFNELEDLRKALAELRNGNAAAGMFMLKRVYPFWVLCRGYR